MNAMMDEDIPITTKKIRKDLGKNFGTTLGITFPEKIKDQLNGL
jgi:hypothetical protein